MVFSTLGLALAVAILIQQTLLLRKLGSMASTFAEVKATLESVATGVNGLEAAIADLKAKVAAGAVITQAELDALGKQASDIVADIADTSDQG